MAQLHKNKNYVLKLLKSVNRLKVPAILKVLVIVLALGTIYFAAEAEDHTPNIQPGYYEVVSVSDGDTIVVDMSGEEQRVRLIGVDTPETHHPEKPVQCFGEAASIFTKELIGESRVRLEADSESDNRDVYSRLLRYVYLPDGTHINAEIIKQGYGFAPLAYPHSKLEEFKQYETEARNVQNGLWYTCDTTVNDFGAEETKAANTTEDRR